MLLVDSTIYIDWFRHRVDPRPLLGPFIKARTLAVCGIIRAEVIRSIIHPGQKAKIHAFLDLLEDVAIDATMWRDIANWHGGWIEKGICFRSPILAFLLVHFDSAQR